jgi:hypothetical protein
MDPSVLENVSEETLAAIVNLAKAATNGATFATGIYGYDLSGLVSQVPVNTPTFDRFARRPGDGSLNANWRALLNINNQQPNPFVGPDAGGNFVLLQEVNVSAPYMPVRVSGQVTRDSIDYGKGYADTKAIASMQTLMQWRILDNKAILGGQAFALPAIGTVSLSTSTTGGSIAATTTVHVRVAARSPYNYYWGGSSIASADQSIATGAGSTNSVTATWPAVQGAVAYDIYVAGFYVTTTTVNTYTVTTVPIANATQVPNLPDLFATPPSAVPGTDTSFNASTSYNGVIATLSGDYTTNGPLSTPGTGQFSSGATFQSLNGSTMTNNGQGITEIDNMLLAIYNAAQLSPTLMIMNAQQAQDMAKKVLANNSAVLYLDPKADRTGMTAGGMIGRYINKASGGDTVSIMVDPHYPPGSISFLAERIPYPNSGITSTFEVRTLRDVAEYPYGPQLQAGTVGGGPRDVWDQSSIETVVNRAPVACGMLQNIAAG